ncbi:hypothetical protein GCM10010869_58950 [Mesorhizobium tianshanense]|nr:hypothetical protein GCM10010869_58950 [Mesorhizobium tianshanense]
MIAIKPVHLRKSAEECEIAGADESLALRSIQRIVRLWGAAVWRDMRSDKRCNLCKAVSWRHRPVACPSVLGPVVDHTRLSVVFSSDAG